MARGQGHGTSRRAALALETHRDLAHEGAQGSLPNSRRCRQGEKVGSLPGTPPPLVMVTFSPPRALPWPPQGLLSTQQPQVTCHGFRSYMSHSE